MSHWLKLPLCRRCHLLPPLQLSGIWEGGMNKWREERRGCMGVRETFWIQSVLNVSKNLETICWVSEVNSTTSHIMTLFPRLGSSWQPPAVRKIRESLASNTDPKRVIVSRSRERGNKRPYEQASLGITALNNALRFIQFRCLINVQ